MDEKEPQFTVIDRRKFTSEGDVRPDAAREESSHSEPKPAAAAQPVASGIHAVPQTPVPSATPSAALPEDALPVLEGPSAEESAQSQAAYTETTRQMDEILRSKIPGGIKDTTIGFEHVIQSLYMTAVMHLGAGTPQGEKARIDLMGARQTIDMLEILAKKTSGNLTENEKLMMDSALFEARMMFLEITSAIARNATQQAATHPAPAHPFDPKGKR